MKDLNARKKLTNKILLFGVISIVSNKLHYFHLGLLKTIPAMVNELSKPSLSRSFCSSSPSLRVVLHSTGRN